MERLITRASCSSFEVADDGVEYPSLEVAYKRAVRGALDLAVDEIVRGKDAISIEVSVENLRGEVLIRGVVSAATTALVIA